MQLGRFALSADGLIKLINCNGLENTATHSGTTPKGELSLQWQAPQDFEGEVQFRATVAQTYNSFWVGILSEPVRVYPRGVPLPTPTGISTTRAPIRPTQPNYEPDIQRPVCVFDTYYGYGDVNLIAFLNFLFFRQPTCI